MIGAMVIGGNKLYAMADANVKDSSNNDTQIESIVNNLDTSDTKSNSIIEKAVAGSSDVTKPNASIDSTTELNSEISDLDTSDGDYNNKLEQILKNTSEDTLQKNTELQAKDLVDNIDNVDNLTPTDTYESAGEDGSAQTLAIYKLDSGAEIAVESSDEPDINADSDIPTAETNTSPDSNIYSPCSRVKVSWITNSNIFKKLGSRRYTTIYYLKSSGHTIGRISVTCHYTVGKGYIKERAVKVWEYWSESPLSIRKNGSTQLISSNGKNKITTEGSWMGAEQEFDITSSNNIATSTAVSVASGESVTVSDSAGTPGIPVTWKHSETKSYILRAVVRILKFHNDGTNVKQYGMVYYNK